MILFWMFTSLHNAFTQNFVINLVDAQINLNTDDSEEGGDVTGNVSGILEKLNLFFTLFFTAELIVNMAAHWFKAFVRNW